MSISALGVTSGSAGATYHVTNTANAQFLREVQNLGQQGVLSKNEEMLATLAADAGDSVPVNGPCLSTAS